MTMQDYALLFMIMPNTKNDVMLCMIIYAYKQLCIVMDDYS